MGGVSTAPLAGAVAAAGGLGMLAAAMVPADELAGRIGEAATIGGPDGRIGVGFLMPFLDRDAFEVAAEHAAVVECFYAEADPALVEVVHATGALAAWQVGSVDDARVALDAGCDFVVVQGVEAGGHVHGDRPLGELLAAVRGLTDRPIVAAGGIGTGPRAAALLDAGADAVRVGTRFLAAAEADVHPEYVAALVDATADETVVTETFAFAWPDAPHRVLRSSIDASDLAPNERLPLPPGREFTGDVAAAALYSGRSVDAVTGTTTAAEVVAEFAAALVGT
jgi:NAD(P)H-dependent flavin oxidoreductase YrpB (nitropropane dioxygenase family)